MNVNVPVSNNHPQSYAIIQNAQAPIIASGPTAVTTLSTGQQQQHHHISGQGGGGGGGGDIHICGTCGTQFTEIKEFVGHKRQGCHGEGGGGGGGGGSNMPQSPQLSATSSVTQAQHHPGSVMGVPVGMPHVVLQTASGPPQVYRIVLEPSVAPAVSQAPSQSQAPAPVLAQALSGTTATQLPSNPAQQNLVSTSNHLNFTPSHNFASSSTQMPSTHLPGSQHHLATASPHQHLVSTSNQQLLSPTSSHHPATSAQQHLVSSHTQTHSTIQTCQVTQGTDTWHITQPLSEGRGEREAGIAIGNANPTSLEDRQDRHQTNNDSTSMSAERPGRTEVEQVEGEDGGLSAAAAMHTEEEDVATFLATQLASQAAPPHTSSVVSEHLMVLPNGSEDVSGTRTTVTTTTTTQPQHQIIHIPFSHQHHQPSTSDAVNSGMRGGSMSSRRYNKPPTPDPLTMNMDSKANIIPVGPKQRGGQDGTMQKEKTCPMEGCKFTTFHNKDLNRHIRKHTGEKPYQCEECGTSFSRGDKLKVHLRIHSNVRPYWCTEAGCQYRAIDSGSLRKHMRTHTDERPYRCQLCPYRARDGSQLTVHLRTHTGDAPFHCMVDNCVAAFKTSSDLRRHERLHTGIKPYKCTSCDYACAIKSNLTVHMRLNHFKGANFSCTKCDFLGNSRKQLKDHEKSHAHVLLQCELCDHVSTSNTGLRQHMYIHSHEKPFQCRYCSFTCKTTGNLRYHVRNKHGCEVFGHKRGRGALMTTLAGGRKGNRRRQPSCHRSFKCEECGSGFVREDSYRSHMRQHQKRKMAQAISGKLESDVFSVVVQDDGLMGVEQTDNAVAGSRDGGEVTNFPRINSDTLQPNTLLSPTAVGDGSGTQNGDNNVSGYSSYVITIDGISTVFSNPVRIPGTSEPGETTDNGDQLPSTVEVITGDILTSPTPSTKVTVTGHQDNYDFGEDTKTHTHGFELTPNKINPTQHMYDLATESKTEPGQTGFSETPGSTTEYHTHPESPTIPHTVLIEQPNIEASIDSSLQVHNLSAKPKIE